MAIEDARDVGGGAAGGSSRPRQVQAVRAALVGAALDELREVGPAKASLRSIARRVGMAHQSIAYHFVDRTALFTAVAVDAFDLLVAECEVALETTSTGHEHGARVAAVGQAYIRFARSDAERFRLMFGSPLTDPGDASLLAAAARMWDLHHRTVEEALAHGWGAGAGADQVAVAAWSFAHGLSALERDLGGALPAHVDAEALLELVAVSVIPGSPPRP